MSCRNLSNEEVKTLVFDFLVLVKPVKAIVKLNSLEYEFISPHVEEITISDVSKVTYLSSDSSREPI